MLKKNMQRSERLGGVRRVGKLQRSVCVPQIDHGECMKDVYHEKTPKPFANHAKESIVIITMPKPKPNACRSMDDRAPEHDAHS